MPYAIRMLNSAPSPASSISTLYSAGLITLEGVPRVLAAIADITAQKRAEEALQQSESMFRMLAETMQAGIFICRKDGTFCYFNPPLERFSGYSAAELRRHEGVGHGPP